MGINYGALAIRRPDVVQFFGGYGWDVSKPDVIFPAWWQLDRCSVPQVPADPIQPPPARHDDSCTFATLYDYAFFKGATDTTPVITPPPNTSPGSGGIVKSAPPGGGTTAPADSWHQAVAWIQNNPLLALAGAGAAFFIFLRPGSVSFSRNPRGGHFLSGLRR